MDDRDDETMSLDGSPELAEELAAGDAPEEGSSSAGRGLLGQATKFDPLKRSDGAEAHAQLDGSRRRAVLAMCRVPTCLDYLIERLSTVCDDSRKQDALLFEARGFAGAGGGGLMGNDNKRRVGVDASNLESIRLELADVATGLDLVRYDGDGASLEADALERIEYSVGLLRPGSDLMREVEALFKGIKADVSRLCAGATALREQIGANFDDGESFLLGEGCARGELSALLARGCTDAAGLLSDIERVEVAHRASLPLLIGSVRSHRSASAEYRRLRNSIVESNLKLIGDILSRNGIYASDPHFDDMTQEGALGLLAAAERYDFSSGFQFSTFASWWTLSFVQRYRPEKARTVRVPWMQHQKARRAVAQAISVETKLGRPALPGEVAQACGVDADDLAKASEVLLPARSMDEIVGEDGDETYGARMADDSVDLLGDLDRAQISELVQRALRMLPAAERTVLAHRYGLGARGARSEGLDPTCGEVGLMVGLKKNAVRDRELAAFKKLLDGPLGPALKAAANQ